MEILLDGGPFQVAYVVIILARLHPQAVDLSIIRVYRYAANQRLCQRRRRFRKRELWTFFLGAETNHIHICDSQAVTISHNDGKGFQILFRIVALDEL